ncbi:D-xylose-proton symporter-like 1 [Schistosoma japonicum]|uniref:D-xylose-proton symporter-like 1 n=1 Tax=Schistosoma japonicum TaxID=6182 RepID=A0A4Z2DB50_SCHJA|nr:Facilitated trehalose transporter Tret1 [Schistosoma japonicum]TNN13705.1 D-xylose-proton symporter-like 1 [Schistosoma japonicum]TNN13706.1 D-xylose-proton symporter-like 1 [Schistosoma japonicum]
MITSRPHSALFVSILSATTSGLAFGFTSATTLQIYFDTIWTAVSTGIVNIGGLIGCLLSTWFIRHYGHRRTLLFSYSLSFMGWIVLFLSSSAVYERYSPTVSFMLGRLLTGLGCGLTLTTNIILIYEIIPSSWKVMTGSLLQVGVTCGIVVDYALAIYLNWDIISLIFALISMSVAFLTYILPESNRCVTNDNLQLAGNELLSRQIEVDLMHNKNVSKYLSDHSTSSFSSSTVSPSSTYVLNNQASRRHTVYILMTFQQLTGMNVIVYFGESVCLVGGSVSYRCAFITGLFLFIFSIISIFIIRIFSWRKLLVIGAIILALSHLLFSFPLLKMDTRVSLLHQIYFTVCAFSFTCSWGPLPFLISIELFPQINRNYTIKTCLTVSWIVCFIVTFLFEPFLSWISVSMLFCIFSIACLLSCFYVYRYVPDMNAVNIL